MGTSKSSLIFALFCTLSSLGFAVETVTLLDRGEPNEAMTFHADHLWVGRSRKDFSADYKISIFDRSDRLVHEIPLKHSLQFLYPYSADSVIAVGTGHSPNLTMYTIATRRGGRFSFKTTTIPAAAWANRWLGTINGRQYFTDPGGNPEDVEASENPTLPGQTLFRMDLATPRYLNTRLRLPVGGMALDGKLFVLQREGIGAWQSNLVIVNPAGGNGTKAFANPRQWLSGITRVVGGSLVAISERAADQLLILDTKTMKLVAELKTAAEPRAVAALGNCALVGSMSQRGVRAFRSVNGNYEVAADLTMDLPSNEFAMLFHIAVDETTGRVYGRSNFPCNPMVEACTDDRNRVVSWKLDANALSRACN